MATPDGSLVWVEVWDDYQSEIRLDAVTRILDGSLVPFGYGHKEILGFAVHDTVSRMLLVNNVVQHELPDYATASESELRSFAARLTAVRSNQPQEES